MGSKVCLSSELLHKPRPDLHITKWGLVFSDTPSLLSSSPRLDFLQEERLRRGVQLSGVEVSGPAPPAALCNMSSASQKKSFWAAIKGIQPTISFIFSIRSCNVGQLWIWLRLWREGRLSPVVHLALVFYPP